MLEDYNPWWSNLPDYFYEVWKESIVQWTPDIISSFSLDPFSLHFLVGPRQVGKSTSLRIFIHQLIEGGFDKNKICYLPCDRILDFRELQNSIQLFLDAVAEDTKLLILDEITFVKEWWRAIKDFIDRGLFKKMVIYVSGSASMELLKQREYFPGRRGSGKDFILHPLDFNEYLRHIGDMTPNNRDINQLSVMEYLKKHRLQANKIGKLFDQYLITGGFPHAILEYIQDGKVTYKSYNIYIDWIKNDFVKLGKNEGYLREIIHSLLSSVSSPLSYTGIANNTSITSSHTVGSYIQLLSDIFVLNILPFRYADGRIGLKKNKKIHITDPFLQDALSHYTNITTDIADKVEAVVASHLAKVSDVYYWRGKTSEVDVISILESGILGVEVKWSDRIRKKPRYREPGAEIITLDKVDIALFLGYHNWS